MGDGPGRHGGRTELQGGAEEPRLSSRRYRPLAQHFGAVDASSCSRAVVCRHAVIAANLPASVQRLYGLGRAVLHRPKAALRSLDLQILPVQRRQFAEKRSAPRRCAVA